MKLNSLLLIFVFLYLGTKSIAQNINYDSLKIILDSVHYYDQYFYNSNLKNKKEYTTKELSIIKKVEQRHVQNLEIVTTIIDKYGWLGKEEVGEIATSALWLTIQHNDLATQLKYLPLLKEAVENGKAFASDVAMLEDRMAIKQGKKQIYGSQLPPHPITGKSSVWPIENPEAVDDRRAKVGLDSMAEYVTFWNIQWDVQVHIRVTKALIEKGLMDFYAGKE